MKISLLPNFPENLTHCNVELFNRINELCSVLIKTSDNLQVCLVQEKLFQPLIYYRVVDNVKVNLYTGKKVQSTWLLNMESDKVLWQDNGMEKVLVVKTLFVLGFWNRLLSPLYCIDLAGRKRWNISHPKSFLSNLNIIIKSSLNPCSKLSSSNMRDKTHNSGTDLVDVFCTFFMISESLPNLKLPRVIWMVLIIYVCSTVKVNLNHKRLQTPLLQPKDSDLWS